jgi:hypothetical protein
MHGMFTTALSQFHVENTNSGSPHSNMGKLKMWTVSVAPCATQMKTGRKIKKSSIQTDEAPFQRLLSG